MALLGLTAFPGFLPIPCGLDNNSFQHFHPVLITISITLKPYESIQNTMFVRLVPKSAALHLRKLKACVYGLNARLHMIKNRICNRSNTKKVLILSFGGWEGSPMLARAAYKLGYSVHVLAPKFPSYEGRYATDWSKVDAVADIEGAVNLAAKIKPIAALVEIRNVLLPAKKQIQTALSLRDFGDVSFQTSNSKIRVREILSSTSLRNIEWSTLDKFDNSGMDYPVIVKPETGSGSKGVTFVQTHEELKQARESISALSNDPAVGGRILVEQYIDGDNYDVTGIVRDGEIYPFTVQLMNFTPVNGAMPPSFYLHNPPISAELRDQLIETAHQYISALGVKVGAFTCELRQDSYGNLYQTDFANRIATPTTVSKAAGNSLNEFYVRSMCEENFTKPTLQQNCVYQRFVRDSSELSKFDNLLGRHPELAVDVRKLASKYAGVDTLARIAIWSPNFEQLKSVLNEFELVPEEFRRFDIN